MKNNKSAIIFIIFIILVMIIGATLPETESIILVYALLVFSIFFITFAIKVLFSVSKETKEEKNQLQKEAIEEKTILVSTPTEKISCPKCGYETLISNDKCPKCGNPLKSEDSTIKDLECPFCHSPIKENDVFCGKCGKALSPNPKNLYYAKDGTPFDKTKYDPIFFKEEDDILNDLIKKELENDPTLKEKSLKSIEKRKLIMTIIYGVICFIIFNIYIWYHVGLPFFTILFIVLTIIYVNIVIKYNVRDYIKKEIKSRPDEKINYVISSVLSAGIDNRYFYLLTRLLIVIIFLLSPIFIYSKPYLIYEKQDNSYVVRYYTIGVLKKDKELEIPSEYKNKPVVGIRGDVFKNIHTLERIYLPQTITEIRGGAFEYCTNLKQINLPNGITEIHGNTFEGCSSLESINIPQGVTRIGGSAFRDCTNLKEATIPESVTYIGSSAFRNTLLENVCISKNAEVNERAFKETYPHISFYENNCIYNEKEYINYYSDGDEYGDY